MNIIEKQKIKRSLNFYLENGLNEVIMSSKKTLKNKKNNIAQEIPIKTNSEQKKIIKIFDENKVDLSKSSTIKTISSSSDAISILAKKNLEDSDTKKFIPISKIIEDAKNSAKKCNNIFELKKAVENFDGCNLKKIATNTVFCDGNPDSKIMVIGEAPGNHEDLQGIPFCGESGKLLDAMFQAIDLDRSKIYITNVIFWRPPGNRKPTEEELSVCKPFVEKHIELINPKLIILVGSTAMSAILGINDPVTGIRGKIIKYRMSNTDKEIDSFVIFHPSYLMRQSSKKRIAWRDMLEIERIIKK